MDTKKAAHLHVTAAGSLKITTAEFHVTGVVQFHVTAHRVTVVSQFHVAAAEALKITEAAVLKVTLVAKLHVTAAALQVGAMEQLCKQLEVAVAVETANQLCGIWCKSLGQNWFFIQMILFKGTHRQ